MRILGIDPGLATVGIGIIDADSPQELRCIEWLTITTAAGLPLPDRLCEIKADLAQLLQDVKPDLAVIEKLFFATNERTAIDVAQARGVIVCTVAEAGIPIVEPTPLQMKLAVTGDGQADKLQVQTMLLHLLQLKEIPKPDDAADALGLAIYGALQSTGLAAAH
jgi:crossover junction endodeoxyribonuclease RuvC